MSEIEIENQITCKQSQPSSKVEKLIKSLYPCNKEIQTQILRDLFRLNFEETFHPTKQTRFTRADRHFSF